MNHHSEEAAVSVPDRAGRFILNAAAASAIMSISQYVEIGLTHRDPSDLPIRLIQAILKHQAKQGLQRRAAGELGQGTLAAAGLASAHALHRAPTVPAIVLNALMMSLGNAAAVRAAGLGGMPWTWSRGELAVDLTHKTVLSLATRAIIERHDNARRRQAKGG
jgi:hypothetical protein